MDSVEDTREDTNRSKNKQVSVIIRQMLTQDLDGGQYFSNDQIKEMSLCFFFQAEDGIRDVAVTGVQTCALPISRLRDRLANDVVHRLYVRHRHRLIYFLHDLTQTPGETRRLNARANHDRHVHEWTLTRGEIEFRFRQIGRASCRERV